MGRIADLESQTRILVYDIENRPPCSFHWQHRGDMYIGPEQMLDPGGVMAWSAQWVGESKVRFMSDHHHGHNTMIEGLYALLIDADVVVGYNHERFDNPHMATEFDAAGVPRLQPVPQIDLLKVVRQNFKFPHNTLKYVAQRLGLTHKVSNDGWPLWTECVTDADGYPYLGPVPEGGGDPSAWRKMRRYAKGDTVVTTELLNYLRGGGYIKKWPHAGLFDGGDLDACPVCGTFERHPVKDHVTGVSRYPAFRCANVECNHLYRLPKAIGRTTGTRSI